MFKKEYFFFDKNLPQALHKPHTSQQHCATLLQLELEYANNVGSMMMTMTTSNDDSHNNIVTDLITMLLFAIITTLKQQRLDFFFKLSSDNALCAYLAQNCMLRLRLNTQTDRQMCLDKLSAFVALTPNEKMDYNLQIVD